MTDDFDFDTFYDDEDETADESLEDIEWASDVDAAVQRLQAHLGRRLRHRELASLVEKAVSAENRGEEFDAFQAFADGYAESGTEPHDLDTTEGRIQHMAEVIRDTKMEEEEPATEEPDLISLHERLGREPTPEERVDHLAAAIKAA